MPRLLLPMFVAHCVLQGRVLAARTVTDVTGLDTATFYKALEIRRNFMEENKE